jgi:DNA-binding response OmpR family regulator
MGPVLVVEDDPLVGRSVTRWLSDHGWPTVLAASADDALLKAREADPVVAICDVDLGGGPDGAWLARAVALTFSASAVVVALLAWHLQR